MAGAEQRRTQEQRSSSTQEKLGRAAFELIRDYGYANFRVASVAKEAGVSQGGQLHHFPTKDSMTMAVIDYAIAKARAVTENNLVELKPNQNLILAIAEDSRDYYFSDSFDVAMDITKGCSGNEHMRQFIAEAHRGYRDDAEGAWRDHLVGDGWSKTDAEDVIAMTASLVRGFAIRAMIRPDNKQLRRLLKRWLSMVKESF